ncbi:MAG: hypothetical protein IJQ02_00660 [Oscillospiraceae bacterium]|nr:hypothetical protein [Bacillota bacterium]MBR0159795.1 hypothetical protein [Oscillospiraceae bacterium]
MKKTLLSLIIIMTLLFTACGSTPSSFTESTDEDGNQIIKSENSITIYPEQLPCKLPYNDETIVITDFRLYQMELNYENYLFAVADIDLSGLSDKSFHWIFEDKDLSYNVYLDKGKNAFDFESMDQLGSVTKYTDAKQIRICWSSNFFNKYKEDFDETSVTLAVFATQQEGVPYHISYRPNTETIPGIPAESDEDYKFIAKKLQEEKLTWEDLGKGK